mmetsp:Transcript_51560/g.130360  ORF Transcript_51560/g.130360 Transcript_51560/m.130360 type:complete len:795 (+) Transcript_51560:51-2435(+)
MAAQDPPLYSTRSLALIASVVLLGVVAGLLVLFGESRDHSWHAGDSMSAGSVAAFINGITSMWFPIPSILAASTPEQFLMTLGPRQYQLRQIVLCFPWISMCMSLLAWYHWNGLAAIGDQIVAFVGMFLTMVLGIWRGQWVALCTWIFLMAMLASITAEQLFMRDNCFWFHFAFRCAGLCAGLACTSAGHLIETPLQLLQSSILLFCFAAAHIAVELRMTGCEANSWCHHLLAPGSYLKGMVRCCLAGLLYLFTLILTVGQIRTKLGIFAMVGISEKKNQGDDESDDNLISDEVSSCESQQSVHDSSDNGSKEFAQRRLHHLDWLRAAAILLAVCLHIAQILRAPWPWHHDDNDFFQDEENAISPDWWYYRLTAHGRLFVIPILFYISGAAMALGGGSLGPFLLKISLVTLCGCGQNYVLYATGPQDPNCSFDRRTHDECQTGLWLDFLIAPKSGQIFPIIYQLWYTIALVIFISEDIALYSEVRRAYAEKQVRAHCLVLRYFCVAGLYALSVMGKIPIAEFCLLLALEALSSVCIIRSAQLAGSASAETPSVRARLWQYAAIMVAVLQFGYPNFDIQSFDGKLFVYFHIFRQLMAIGFVSTLTRKTTALVLSRSWPLAFIIFVTLLPSSSYYWGGMVAYPWLPHRIDRLIMISASFMGVLMLDRIGHVFGDAGLDLEMPDYFSHAALLMYIAHPVFIVVLTKISGMRESSVLGLMSSCCTGTMGLVAYWRSPCRHDDRSVAALYTGICCLGMFGAGLVGISFGCVQLGGHPMVVLVCVMMFVPQFVQSLPRSK